jgi:hypothetical protein
MLHGLFFEHRGVASYCDIDVRKKGTVAVGRNIATDT